MRPKQFEEWYRTHTEADKQYKGPKDCQCKICFKVWIQRQHYRMWKGYLEYCSIKCRRVALNRQRFHKANLRRKINKSEIEW